MNRRRRRPGETCARLLACIGALAALPAAAAPAPETCSDPPVKVVVVLAPSLQRTTLPARRIQTAVKDAGKILSPHLCRDLQVARVVPWPDAPDRATVDEVLLRLLQTIPREDADLVVGLTSASSRRAAPGQRGATSYEAGYVGLIVDPSLDDVARLLAHEIAHVFGAIHVPGPGNLMYRRVTGETVDTRNAGLLRLHRDRRFDFHAYPLDAARRKAARRLYETALEPGAEGDRDARFMLARIDGEEGRPRAAVARLEPLVNGRDPDPEAAVLLAIAYRKLRRYDDALRLYDSVLAVSPDHHVVHFNRGIALCHKGDTRGAVDAYRRALELSPGFEPAMGNLADVLVERGRPREALDWLERALEISPGDEVARATLGFAYLSAGDPVSARLITEQVLAVDPGSPTAHNTLGLILLAEKDASAAMETFARAAELDPGYADPLLNLAQGYLAAGDPGRAEELARQARELRPAWAPARTVLGRVMLEQGRWDRAVMEFEEAVANDPGYAVAHGLLGYAHLMRNDLGRAASSTRAALDLDDSLAWAWMNLCVVSLRAAEPRAAVGQCRRATELDPDLSEAHLNLGHARMSVGDLRAARDAYARALEAGPQNGLAHNNLAVIHYRLGTPAEAWAHVSQARALGVTPNPDFLEALEQATRDDGPR